MSEKKFPFDHMKAVENVTNDTAEIRVNVINSGDIGGGTQYADGDAVATPTGTVVLGDDGTNVQAIKTDSDGELQVDVLSVAGSVAVTNTGLTELAAAINASSQMDVNIAASGATVPVSNAGLTALNGAISGTEVQVDVVAALPAGTNNIGDVDIASIAAGDNNIGNVDVVSSALPTGAATLAEQQTQTTSLAAIETAVEILDNAISGSEMQVDIVASLPAGTNNIGDVDVLTVPRSLMGPSQPGTAIDSYQQVAINLVAGADQVLVASAANKQIWVYGICISLNVAGTVSFQDQDDLAITGIMNLPAAGGFSHSPSGNFSMPIWKLGTDKDLEIDIVDAEVDGWISYAIVSV